VSTKNTRLSSTTVSTTSNWVNTDVPLHSAKGTTVVHTDPNAVIISGKSHINKEGRAEIVISVEPTTVSKRQAIRRLNEELEGRFAPSDTYASRTAG